ncbi:MAG: hypothetical protein GXC76_01025 [Rhodanobacteraceae bacterium]|jgi:hypothetical protein|nr:hypothetical protein [Rhodanobacteraceae bacterium]
MTHLLRLSRLAESRREQRVDATNQSLQVAGELRGHVDADQRGRARLRASALTRINWRLPPRN